MKTVDSGHIQKEKLDSTQEYVQWVKDQYPAQGQERFVQPFVPPDVNEDKTLDMLARYLLYRDAGMNILLDGRTGTGKTTLVEYVASQRGEPLNQIPAEENFTYGDAIGMPMETSSGGIVFQPGPLLRFLIFEGDLLIDEISNIQPKLGTALHGVLQGKPIEVTNTQYGFVSLNTIPGKHHITGTANFHYKKPRFDRATLQRWIFMDVPYLEDSFFKQNLMGEHQKNKSFDDYDEMMNQLYPWKQDEFIHPMDTDLRWKPLVDNDTAQTLGDLCCELRKTITSSDKFANSLDTSGSTYKRILSFYSPFIDSRSFEDIVNENLVNPVTAEYPDFMEERIDLKKTVSSIIQKYAPKLFKHRGDYGLC